MEFQKMAPESGYLELFLGPMWSGKTSELVRRYTRLTSCDISVLAINYIDDIRYSKDSISTHDKICIPCSRAQKLSHISDIINDKQSELFKNSTIILINEGQFFDDIVEWVKCAVDIHKKHVFICGLDGDYKREPFGNWLNLIPLCDKVTKLTAYCKLCKKREAIFSHRIGDEKSQTVIGNNYMSLCRNCYLSF
tara:strand:+ start:5744 stop:6325 length:582 start_codon:yes stop_codon:yes gene_type:complete